MRSILNILNTALTALTRKVTRHGQVRRHSRADSGDRTGGALVAKNSANMISVHAKAMVLRRFSRSLHTFTPDEVFSGAYHPAGKSLKFENGITI